MASLEYVSIKSHTNSYLDFHGFQLSVRSSNFCNLKAVPSEDKFNFKSNPPWASKINVKGQEGHWLAKNAISKKVLFTTSHILSSNQIPPGALSSAASNVDNFEDGYILANPRYYEKEFNRMNGLVWVLHEFSRSFSLAIQTLALATTGRQLQWLGMEWMRMLVINT